jgi:hypothetical protein
LVPRWTCRFSLWEPFCCCTFSYHELARAGYSINKLKKSAMKTNKLNLFTAWQNIAWFPLLILNLVNKHYHRKTIITNHSIVIDTLNSHIIRIWVNDHIIYDLTYCTIDKITQVHYFCS